MGTVWVQIPHCSRVVRDWYLLAVTSFEVTGKIGVWDPLEK